MGVSEDIAPWLVREITGGSGRFADPFAEPNGYSIVEAEDEAALLAARGRYLDRLRYAVANADALVTGAFRREFYDFYGVDRAKVCSPEEMCRGLVFDSFVLDARDGSVGACLTNSRFLFGHFIECWWDGDWRLRSVCIC